MPKIVCPNCHARIRFTDQQIGRVFPCPRCREILKAELNQPIPKGIPEPEPDEVTQEIDDWRPLECPVVWPSPVARPHLPDTIDDRTVPTTTDRRLDRVKVKALALLVCLVFSVGFVVTCFVLSRAIKPATDTAMGRTSQLRYSEKTFPDASGLTLQGAQKVGEITDDLFGLLDEMQWDVFAQFELGGSAMFFEGKRQPTITEYEALAGRRKIAPMVLHMVCRLQTKRPNGKRFERQVQQVANRYAANETGQLATEIIGKLLNGENPVDVAEAALAVLNQ